MSSKIIQHPFQTSPTQCATTPNAHADHFNRTDKPTHALNEQSIRSHRPYASLPVCVCLFDSSGKAGRLSQSEPFGEQVRHAAVDKQRGPTAAVSLLFMPYESRGKPISWRRNHDVTHLNTGLSLRERPQHSLIHSHMVPTYLCMSKWPRDKRDHHKLHLLRNK